MGLAEGGITFQTYFVDGELPTSFRSYFLERIEHFAFEPLTVESEEDVSYGWVPVGDPLAERFAGPDVYFNEYLVLGLRMDRWAIPAPLVKARVRQAEAQKRAETGRTKLSRLERGEVIDRERTRLKRQSLPAVRLLDFAWNLNSAHLRFSNTSRTTNEIFVDLFERTFGLQLVADSPYMSALHCDLDDERVARLADIEPSGLLGGWDGSG
jgi:hypothetical protein